MKQYEVIVSHLAESDINEIINYFIPINKEYVIKLYQTFKDRITELHTLPNKGRIVPELEKKGIHDFRELIEGNYRIVYSIHATSVHILATVDSRRNLDEILVNKIIDFFNEE
ncbi:Plasmid stabilization system protein [uncultured spirochete]|jgi:toxin ParE1/3/4|uniref:Plasmid stabilization system protein n=1 Tax=uncultured spirochete TaxID=156406 RepID=A0A3P3XSW6_9SPIR|nr:Plasmid stabilization system protein [uncultured spirochete]